MLLEAFAFLLRFVLNLAFWCAIFATILYFVQRDRPLLNNSISHWHQSIPNLTGTTHAFYLRVEELITEQAMPDVEIRAVTWREAGLLSTPRKYLRIARSGFVFDLCVAPFGRDFFVSIWLCEDPRSFLNFLAGFPFLGWFVRFAVRTLDPDTYYTVDSRLMFESVVHGCILQVLDEMTTEQGLDPIPPEARKPVLRDLYGRKKLAA